MSLLFVFNDVTQQCNPKASCLLSSIAHMLQEKQAHWDNMVFIRYFNFASLQASGIDGLFLFLNMGTWHEGKGISNWVYKQYMGKTNQSHESY